MFVGKRLSACRVLRDNERGDSQYCGKSDAGHIVHKLTNICETRGDDGKEKDGLVLLTMFSTVFIYGIHN